MARYVYPTSDGTNQYWTPSTGTDFFAVIDDVNSADYVEVDWFFDFNVFFNVLFPALSGGDPSAASAVQLELYTAVGGSSPYDLLVEVYKSDGTLAASQTITPGAVDPVTIALGTFATFGGAAGARLYVKWQGVSGPATGLERVYGARLVYADVPTSIDSPHVDLLSGHFVREDGATADYLTHSSGNIVRAGGVRSEATVALGVESGHMTLVQG